MSTYWNNSGPIPGIWEQSHIFPKYRLMQDLLATTLKYRFSNFAISQPKKSPQLQQNRLHPLQLLQPQQLQHQ